MKFLPLDVDRSFASIGGDAAATKLFGKSPVPISRGLRQISKIIDRLFTVQEIDIEDDFLGKGKSLGAVLSPRAKELGIGGLIIDTISNAFTQEERNIVGAIDLTNIDKVRMMEQRDWGTLKRIANDLFYKLFVSPIPLILNSHYEIQKDGESGKMFWGPALGGKSKEEIKKIFDVIVFNRVSPGVDGARTYRWLTRPTEQFLAKDRLSVLDSEMPMDFGIIFDRYAQAGIMNPKILVIGDSGTGKTFALRTVANIKAVQPITQKVAA